MNYLKKDVPLSTVFLAIVSASTFFVGGNFFYHKHKAYEEEKLAFETRVKELSQTLQITEEAVFNLKKEKLHLEEELEEEKSRLKKISNTVSELKKLTETDPELLKKYSKVYFLNEHYVPEKLREVDAKYVYPADRVVQVHSKVHSRLEDLLDEALQEGVQLFVTSGYRSFETQQAIKTHNRVTYGAGTANSFIADQGYSEHQLGTTVDFTVPKTGLTLAFENTPAYKWLLDNAHRYGFVISYPKNNTYYIFEPWHWRFVGEDLARKLKREEKFFYDLDQREIDKYLGELFE